MHLSNKREGYLLTKYEVSCNFPKISLKSYFTDVGDWILNQTMHSFTTRTIIFSSSYTENLA